MSDSLIGHGSQALRRRGGHASFRGLRLGCLFSDGAGAPFRAHRHYRRVCGARIATEKCREFTRARRGRQQSQQNHQQNR